MSEIDDIVSKLPPTDAVALEIFAKEQAEKTFTYYRNPDIETYIKIVTAVFFLGFLNDGINDESKRRSEI